ncbi:MAG: epoxyqueuosine reductase QueH [Clostridia bacterium]|nr:epoxyqueuosine reductase QueH [Clostridia bacterium]NCD03748.1 epoxyqueuosine reductase QueH [Clostridia bacterium]
MDKRNYQSELDKVIDGLDGRVPKLLLHSCCAPCSSYVLEYLSNYFEITVFYYNPNISPAEEYEKRVEEQQKFIMELPTKYPIAFIAGKYEPERFYELAKGLEQLPEGGERCFKCYELRLREAAICAKNADFDYFTTTLSISPLKNAEKLNEIGENLGRQYSVSYLPGNFKKKNGYLRSVKLSAEYGLYRQDYCGCIYSKRDAEKRVTEQCRQ